MLFRRSRRVRLDRLQAVDVVRPLVARALGLAELRLEVAGGSSSEAPLAYLSERGRAAAAGRAARPRGRPAARHSPRRPRRCCSTVPLGRLVEATAAVGASPSAAVVVLFGGLRRRRHRRRVVGARPGRAHRCWPRCRLTMSRVGRAVRLHGGRVTGRAAAAPRAARDPRRRPCRPAGCRRCGSSSRGCGARSGWCRVEANVAGYVGDGPAGGLGARARSPPRDEALRLLALRAARARHRRGAADRRAPPGPVAGPAGVAVSSAVGADDRFLVVRRGRLAPRDRPGAAREGAERADQPGPRCSAGWGWPPCTSTPRRDRSRPTARTAQRARAARRRGDAARMRAAARPDRWMQPPDAGRTGLPWPCEVPVSWRPARRRGDRPRRTTRSWTR